MRCHRFLPLLAEAIALLCFAPCAQAFDLAPWCIGNGGGTFLCASKEERAALVAKSASLDYLEFVQVAFSAGTIQFVPAATGSSAAMTMHRSGGGILELTSSSSDSVRSKMVIAATEWFRAFCAAKSGSVVRYPRSDQIINAERIACHSTAEAEASSPMFGIQLSRAVVLRAKDQVPVVVMEHLTGKQSVLEAWGYPKIFKAGDSTEQGMVVEIKPPLARVQRMNGEQASELWIPIKSLRPAAKATPGG